MVECYNCKNPIEFPKEGVFITQCKKCRWLIRVKELEDEILGKNNDILPPQNYNHNLNEIFKIGKEGKNAKQLVYCFNFNWANLKLFKKVSTKASQALENFLNNDKKSLTYEEKNILYKLKSESVEEIENKIKYLQAKIQCIKLLNYLHF